VVNIKIDNQDPGQALTLRVSEGDGHVVEDTESHGLRSSGVMTGRSHQCEPPFALALQNPIQDGNQAACSKKRVLEGGLGDVRVAVVHEGWAALTGSADGFEVRFGVNAKHPV
jgi:hypothetical protein